MIDGPAHDTLTPPRVPDEVKNRPTKPEPQAPGDQVMDKDKGGGKIN